MSKKNNFISPKKQQKQDTKKPIFWVLFFLIIFWTVSGILGVCSFIGLSPSNNNTLNVKADSVTNTYVYEGNNFYTPTYSLNSVGNPVYEQSPTALSVDIKLFITECRLVDNSIVSIPTYSMRAIRLNMYPFLSGMAGFYVPDLNNSTYESVSSDTYYTNADGFFTVNHHIRPSLVGDNYLSDLYLYYENFLTLGVKGYYGIIHSEVHKDFNCNVSSIRFYGQEYETNKIDVNEVKNVVIYTDTNGNTFTITFEFSYQTGQFYTGVVVWEDRIYYISNTFTDNQSFQNGYNQGYQQGRNDYTNSGYQNGYDNGFTAGKNQGYNDGVLAANKYSFLGLMTAVVDAPIQALTGLFGFELLGVNLMSVISGLFTVCVILVLLRLLLGGGLSG